MYANWQLQRAGILSECTSDQTQAKIVNVIKQRNSTVYFCCMLCLYSHHRFAWHGSGKTAAETWQSPTYTVLERDSAQMQDQSKRRSKQYWMDPTCNAASSMRSSGVLRHLRSTLHDTRLHECSCTFAYACTALVNTSVQSLKQVCCLDNCRPHSCRAI